jgi:uncharacterized protein
MMNAKDISINNIVLQAQVGSVCHGLAIEGSDDVDLLAVCIEPPECVIGLRHFEQYIHRTAEERHEALPPGHSPRSMPGDVDLTIYSLRKYCRLALAGNPTILSFLYVPNYLVEKRQGAWLLHERGCFLSKHVGRAFLGYMVSQRQRLTGDRGQMRVHRPELIEKYSFDTKYCSHVLRLGVQGIEFLTKGTLTLPMPENERLKILEVRQGKWDLNQALTWAGELERELKDLVDHTILPDEPDHERINYFLIDAYRSWWIQNGRCGV